MGTLINGIHGPYIGKVGNLVGSSRNGKPYLKAVPLRRTPKPTEREKQNQSKFSKAHYWLQPLLYFIRVGFKDFRKSGEFNAAKSYLLKNAFEGTKPDLSINPALVKLSIGDLPLSADMAVGKTEADKIEFTWTYERGDDNANAADQVMMLAYDVEAGDACFETTGQFRRVGVDTLTVEKGKTYHVYMAFTSYDRMRQSDSVYLGEISM